MSESFGILTGFGHHRSVSSISELDQILDEIVDQARNADAPVAINLEDVSELVMNKILLASTSDLAAVDRSHHQTNSMIWSMM